MSGLLRDAPWIESAERTGYPRRGFSPYCSRCGEKRATDYDEAKDAAYCRDCALQEAEQYRQDAIKEIYEGLSAMNRLDGDELLEFAGFYTVENP